MKFKINTRHRANGLDLLNSLDDRSVDQVWFDPQHREQLEKMEYGNEGSRQRGRSALPQMKPAVIKLFMEEIERVLRSQGYVFLWIDKFLITSGHWRRWLPDATTLSTVDLMVWDKQRFGMGRRFRCQTEFLVVLQKGKTNAKAWTDHGMPDVCQAPANTKLHAHAKPEARIERIIEATTKRNALIVDPAAGGFGVMRACVSSGRRFLGCDLIAGSK